MEDFSKQKIVWIELADKGRFFLDIDENFLTLNGTFIMTGNHLEYLCCVLNNPIISWLFNTYCISSGVGTNQWRELYMKNLLIPRLPNNHEKQLNILFNKLNSLRKNKKDFLKIENEINNLLYNFLNLTPDEIEFISFQ